MRGSPARWVMMLLLAAGLLSSPAWGQSAAGTREAADARGKLQAALTRLHAWLGDNSNGQRWRKYLASDLLQRQLTLGNQADMAAVQTVLARYDSGAPGLDLPQFRAVRDALASWSIQTRPTPIEELPALARAAKEEFSPVTSREIEGARKELAQAAGRLNAYLARQGGNGRAWQKYLKLQELTPQLKAGAALDTTLIGGAHERFRANHAGLEKSLLTQVAQALQRYADVAAFAARPDPQAEYAQQLEVLAESLQRYAQQPTDEISLQIAQRLGWLEGTGQARRLVREVRRAFSRPNFYFEASERLVAAGVERKIDRVEPITDWILGTSIEGRGRTVGDLSLQFAPDPRQATLQAALKARVYSDTTGYNGPAVLFSRGVTDLVVSKDIYLREGGFFSGPARAWATTDSNVQGVATDKGPFLDRMVQKGAWKRSGKLKPTTDAIASDHAEDRAEARLNQEVGQMLGKANRRFAERFRFPLVRRGEFPQLVHFSTESNSLHGTVLQANRFQIAAPGPAPEFSDRGDLAIQVHETLLNNFAAAMLAGMRLDDTELRRQVVELTGSLPPELKEDAEEEPWSITFARPRPITVEFLPQALRITIHGERFTSGNQSFQAMNITANYKIEPTSKGTRLVRQGELDIFPPGFVQGRSQLSSKDITLQTILRRKLGRLFKEEIVSEGLELPGAWRHIGKLLPVEVVSDRGWLRIAWRMPATPPPGELAAQEDRP